MTFDAAQNRVVVFGGQNPSTSRLGDTWEYFIQQLAAYTPFGQGCPGSAGTAQLSPDGNELPWLGDTFDLEVTSLPTGLVNTTFGLIGASSTNWLGQSLPLDLGSLGMPGCTLFTSIDDASLLPKFGSTATWALSIPNDPILAGVSVHLQSLVIDPGVNTLGAVLSNAGTAVIGYR